MAGLEPEGFSECNGEKRKSFEDGFCPEAFFEASIGFEKSGRH